MEKWGVSQVCDFLAKEDFDFLAKEDLVAPLLRSGATAQGLRVSKFRRPQRFEV